MDPHVQRPIPAAAQAVDEEKGPTPGVPISHVAPPSNQSVYVPIDGLEVGMEDRRRRVRRRRFWHFATCALLFLVFWRPLVYGVASFFAKFTDKHWAPDIDCQLPLVRQPMVRPSDCETVLNWTTDAKSNIEPWSLHAHTSLTLPVDADELFFLSQGQHAHGTFKVSQSGDSASDALVKIDFWYAPAAENVLGNSTICYLHPSEGQHGLGIFTPHWPSHSMEDRLHFYVHLILPKSNSGEPLAVNKLSTNLPLFAHRLPDLADTAFFKSLVLTSTNAPLLVDSVNADAAALRSLNGHIEGSFVTNRSLELTTSNAPITVNVSLLNRDERNATVLLMSTKNGAINAKVSLNPEHVATPGGAFRVNARTYNAPIDLAFTDAPANSLLNASAVSSNSPVRVIAHPAFEGTFELHSTWFTPPSVVQHGPVEDPLGQHRKRNVLVNTVRRGAIRGEVGWEPKHRDAKSGHIGLETSNAPATLVL